MSSTAERAASEAGWGVLSMLAAAQFIMVLDTTVMNVSISQVVDDLDTTVIGLQGAITAYTLVMAAFMLVGGKIGERLGAKRGFTVGLLVYGLGSLTTALAPNLPVLLTGWSLIEGLGAVMVIPAIAALIATTYRGRQRALAYGILGGVAGASAAAGPLIGGWVTASFSWRYVFAGESLVVLLLMPLLRLIPPTQKKAGALDLVGAVLSASGLGLVVFGVLRSSQWGWVIPRDGAPILGGKTFAPLGLSPALWLMVSGALLLLAFVRHEERWTARGGSPLVDLALLKVERLRAGLVITAAQSFMVLATFFVLPLYLQTVLGFDALETGKTVLPLSVGLLVFALAGASLGARYSPKRIVETGLFVMFVGEAGLLWFLGPEMRTFAFGLSLSLVGAGLGLLASQVGSIVMSSVSADRGSEVGGLQGTSQNLGGSLGTALIGALLIASLSSNFASDVVSDDRLSDQLKRGASAAVGRSADFISTDEAREVASKAGVPSDETEVLVGHYADAQLSALRAALAGIALFGLVTLAYVRRLPDTADEVVGA